MDCPKCQGASSVFETRINSAGKRRRRLCSQCKHRFTTIEVLVTRFERQKDVLSRLSLTIAMLRHVRDSCNTAILTLDSMEVEEDD